MLDEAKDPAIKLFGKTISLPETADVDLTGGGGGAAAVDGDYKEVEMGCSRNVSDGEGTEGGKVEFEDATDTNSEVQGLAQNSDDITVQTAASTQNKNPSPESELPAVQQSSNAEDDENKSQQSGPQDKTLKKPDKILPCPRCSSMETKFCYFNNYNVNQPRHFCKNCQRYWTAGGTMRNVPVGAGRRKSKSTASQYRHIVVSESLQNGGSDLHNRVHHYPGARPANGALLAFGPDSTMCNSMASILNLVENGIQNPDIKLTSPLTTKETGAVNQINGAVSSVETECKPGTKEQGESDNVHVYPPPPVPCFPGAPWPYPWNSAQWSPQLPNPGFNSSGYPVAFYPPGAYWGCSVPGAWAIPWTPPPQSNSPKGSNSGSSPNSPSLGKHSRDGNVLRSNCLDSGETPKDSKPERSLWIPKTLRIDDPEQAAKSSIWTTLGIKNHKPDSACGSGMFRARFSGGDEKNRFIENARGLDVNPAAMSRSHAFNEAL